MRFLKYFSAILFFNLLFATATMAQSKGMVKKNTQARTTAITESFMVLGNCGMCKKTIEQAATTAGATTALWDAETDILSITYDTTKLTKEAVQKAIAQSGYDNAGYKATDEAYNNLHGCCKYDRTGAAGGTKSCEGGK